MMRGKTNFDIIAYSNTKYDINASQRISATNKFTINAGDKTHKVL